MTLVAYSMPYRLLFAALCFAFTAQLAAAADEVDYSADIQPILARKCYACHGPDLQEGSIRFDVRDTLIAEADSGLVPIVPHDISASELLRRVRSEDESERMPPEGKPLSEREIAALESWIEAGAEVTAHWSFQPIQRPELPNVQQAAWPAQPLDRFILSKLEKAELSPAPPASPASLIRRVYMDVIGIPPTPEVVAALSQDWSETKYRQLVDSLLTDPAFGDRWARMWLDVVRYAESNSFERDNPKPNAWRYRDYVISAFNNDKPYDHFVREQIAGDELDEVTDESLTATGFYRLGIWDDEPADPLQARFDEYDDLVSTTGQAFLALTLNCARCHDHKIDPILQKDYYSMVALLRDVTSYADRGDQTTNNQLHLNKEVAAQHKDVDERLRKYRDQLHQMEQEAIVKMDAPDQRATEGPERAKVLREKLKDYMDAETWGAYEALKEQRKAAESERRQLPPLDTVLGLARVQNPPPETHVLQRGSPHSEGDIVPPAFPKLLGGNMPDLSAASAAGKVGRRRALADWLVSDENWMTARVIVNRLWLNYFGRGIVRSPNNFGLMGDAPTHPELLDYLASELILNDWSLKSIHRTILLSSVYRQSCEVDAQALAQDPSNNLFWRQNLRRMSAEQVRDAVLAVTGELNEQRHGEPMYPTLSAEVLASQSRPGEGWGNSSASDQARRSIYIHVKRSLPVPMLSAFDFPETDISCEARFLTTQPGQALTMLNSDWMQLQAAALLARVEREVGPELRAQAARCLELALSRPAKDADVDELLDLVERLVSKQNLDDGAARKMMALVTLNLNGFLYIE